MCAIVSLLATVHSQVECGINSEATLTSLSSRMAVFIVAETVSTRSLGRYQLTHDTAKLTWVADSHANARQKAIAV